MMRRIITITLLFFTAIQGWSQTDSSRLNTITTAVPFLMITPDARAGGMGDAGVSTSPDISSIRWNPSKLAFVENNMGVGLSYVPWLKNLVNDIGFSYLSGYRRLDDQQVIGASLQYFSLGNITFTDDVGNVIGNFTPKEMAFDLAYARKLSDNFSGGIAVRYISSNLTGGQTVQGATTQIGRAVAADVSGYYTNDQLQLGGNDATLNFGFNVSNMGNKMSYSNTARKDFIPTNLRLGGTLMLHPDEYNSIGFTAEFNKLLVPTPPLRNPTTGEVVAGKENNVGVVTGIIQSFYDAPEGFSEELREINPSVGIEYWYDKQFAIRTGYFYEHPLKGNRQYFTVGAGLKYSVFGLDVAYLISSRPNNPLKNTLHFTLSFDFDAFGEQNNGDI